MNTVRKDRSEAVGTIRCAAMPVHVISRLLVASEERVRGVIRDPELLAIWANSNVAVRTVPSFAKDHVVELMEEFVQGQVVDIRIHLLECALNCAVHVELWAGPELDIASIYDLGIDDLWEARLYTITDLLACRTLQRTNEPRIPMDQVLQSHRPH